MYVRQAKQFLRTAIEGFDERKYGFASVVDLLRAAGKEGVLRIERDRQGAVRVFPGANLARRPSPASWMSPSRRLMRSTTRRSRRLPSQSQRAVVAEPVDEPPIVDVRADRGSRRASRTVPRRAGEEGRRRAQGERVEPEPRSAARRRDREAPRRPTRPAAVANARRLPPPPSYGGRQRSRERQAAGRPGPAAADRD